MELSKRLEAIASHVPEGSVLADVGTDHGYIPIELASKGRIKKGIAMDINAGPLAKAASNIHAYHLDDKVAVRLSDGLLEVAPGEVDCVIIAGMGGKLIKKILVDSMQKLNTYNRYIISPHTDLALVRKAMMDLNIHIIDEDMVKEDDHYYTILIATTNKDEVMILPYSRNENPLYFVYGKCLILKKHPLLMEKLTRENTRDYALIEELKHKGVINRISELEHDIKVRDKVISWMK